MIAQLDLPYLKSRPWKLWSRLISYSLFEGRPLTTRGQWINPLVFAHFSVEKQLPPLRPVTKPIFILGTGRSGTTILGIVLSMHHAVGFLNEPKALWHAIHPDEDLIGSYSRKKAYYRLDAYEATHERIRYSHRLYGAYLCASFSSRVVDKYPELIFRVPFVKALFPDARFIFLVRNGWDTCHSIKEWSKRLGGKVSKELHDWWGADRRKWNLLLEQLVTEHPDLAPHVEVMKSWTNQTDMAAVEWIITMREGLTLLDRFPESLYMLRYEDLTSKPRTALTELANFCELPTDDKFISYGEKILISQASHNPTELHPIINDIFVQTMHRLNYI